MPTYLLPATMACCTEATRSRIHHFFSQLSYSSDTCSIVKAPFLSPSTHCYTKNRFPVCTLVSTLMSCLHLHVVEGDVAKPTLEGPAGRGDAVASATKAIRSRGNRGRGRGGRTAAIVMRHGVVRRLVFGPAAVVISIIRIVYVWSAVSGSKWRWSRWPCTWSRPPKSTLSHRVQVWRKALGDRGTVPKVSVRGMCTGSRRQVRHA
jgi:hypothetical protein